MNYLGIATLMVLGVLSVPVQAQMRSDSNRHEETTPFRGDGPREHREFPAAPSHRLPPSPIGQNASAEDYLRSARDSLAAGRTGQAQQSLEMAETRGLSRTVVQGHANERTQEKVSLQIAEARRALGNGQRREALRLIDSILMP
ncbi:hypothetical protein [Pararhodospirillum photometricum]|nr:hypothetical protein [Pararhodospirillum photometricum]